MSEKYDITEILGMSNEFQPNYQHQNPLEFAALTSYYMERYYDFDKEPERYWVKMQAAVKWANKSIMLEKLGLPDIENEVPDLFKSTFAKVAATEPDLMVKSERVFLTEDLQKSMADGTTDRNANYERLWKITYDTITTNGR